MPEATHPSWIPTARIRWTALLGVVAVVLGSTVALASQDAVAAGGPTVSSWLTTPDQTQLLSPAASATFATGGDRPGQLVTVDPSQTFQTIDGFGASITDSSAHLLSALPATQRDQVLRSLFSPTTGIGMNFLRQPIGSSDFVDGPHYTFDDLAAGQTDYTMAHFSVAHDQAQILPLLRTAIQLNPALKVLATPWGQPAWMKANNSTIGGRLIDDPAIYRSYALYLLKFVQAYEAAGVPIYALSVQNEPQNRTPDGYPGTDMPVAAEAAVINQLGPLLRDAGLSRVKILSYDHNWTEHPDDAADAIRLGVPAEPTYPYDILRTSAAQWIAGTGYHCYAGDPSAQTALHNAFPNKDIWFTECSGWHGVNDPPAQFFSDTLKWHAANITIGATQNWAKAVIDWNIALDSKGGPVNGGCGNNPQGMCTGVVTIDGATVTRNAEFYTLGHMSRFAKPGAVRIYSNDVGDVHDVAFRNPDGSIALIATNVGGGSQTFGVSFNDQFIKYTLPPGALATLTWNGGSNPNPPTSPPSSSTTRSTTTSSTSSSTSPSSTTPTSTKPTSTTPTSTTPTSTTPTTVSSSTTSSGPVFDPTKWYQAMNLNSGKCLDDTDWSTANGTPLQQWACGSPAADNQLWRFAPSGDGYYSVVSRHAPQAVWDITGGETATANGSPVQLWDNHGGTNQQWQPIAMGNGYYKFVARNSGKCLDVTTVSGSDGARLQLWDCTGGPAQSFLVVAKG